VWEGTVSLNRAPESDLGAVFLAVSCGYQPGKSALDGAGVTCKRCWEYDWLLEFVIKGLCDSIDHSLLLRAVRKHVTCPWAVLFIERWLTAPTIMEDGTLVERTRGTPQGGVVSPVLANLFQHCKSGRLNISRRVRCPDTCHSSTLAGFDMTCADCRRADQAARKSWPGHEPTAASRYGCGLTPRRLASRRRPRSPPQTMRQRSGHSRMGLQQRSAPGMSRRS
jgi:hypothetical protein